MTSTVLDRPAVMPAAEPTTRTDDELVIAVTQEHIDNGNQADAAGCAVELAAQGQFGHLGWWTMHHGGVLRLLPRSGGTYEYWHSAESERFVRAFDRDPRSVQPARLVFTRESAAETASRP